MVSQSEILPSGIGCAVEMLPLLLFRTNFIFSSHSVLLPFAFALLKYSDLEGPTKKVESSSASFSRSCVRRYMDRSPFC